MVLIKTVNLTKIYPSGDENLSALHNINLEIHEKEMVAISGPSGAGKSTLLNLLGCLDIPTQGKYYLDGEDVSTFEQWRLAEIRRNKIGFVFQEFCLIPNLTAWENVMLPQIYGGVSHAEASKKAKDLLSQMELGNRMHHLPSELSGGQQQRVGIARALAMSPEILLADEPTGNLDSENSQKIIDIILELNKQIGLTVLLVTHELTLAKQLHRQITIRDGQIK